MTEKDTIIEEAGKLCLKFTEKVESGKIKSKETYSDCLTLLRLIAGIKLEGSEDNVRVLRLLEYNGQRNAVEENLKRRGVVKQRSAKGLTIREAILGEFPEIIGEGGEK